MEVRLRRELGRGGFRGRSWCLEVVVPFGRPRCSESDNHVETLIGDVVMASEFAPMTRHCVMVSSAPETGRGAEFGPFSC